MTHEPDWAELRAREIVRFPEVSNARRLVKEIAQALRSERQRAFLIAFHYNDGDNSHSTAWRISQLIRNDNDSID